MGGVKNEFGMGSCAQRKTRVRVQLT